MENDRIENKQISGNKLPNDIWESVTAFINNEDQIWLQQFKILRLKDTQLKALVYMRHSNDGINNSEYREINNMNGVGDDVRAKKDLKKLLNLELVRKTGENKYTRYSLERGLV